MESILETVKKANNLAKEYEAFDSDLIVYTNTALAVLNQLGVGDGVFFSVTGYDETWDMIETDAVPMEMLKTYVGLKVRMLFDPPSGSVAEAYKNSIAELEWRLQVDGDKTGRKETD